MEHTDLCTDGASIDFAAKVPLRPGGCQLFQPILRARSQGFRERHLSGQPDFHVLSLRWQSTAR